MSSSAEAGHQPAAAFFDLDKTIIAKSGTLAYGPSFYRNGLISGGDAVRGAMRRCFSAGMGQPRPDGADPRARQPAVPRLAARLGRGIVARHLDELIVPYADDEARALLDAHRAAGEDVIIVSTSGLEMAGPIGPCGAPRW